VTPRKKKNVPKTSAFVAFEGGGAKAIVHIGAMRAIEKLGHLAIQGVAGTSAGAIIAALYAANFSSEEIFSTTSSNTILTFIDPNYKSTIDLLGRQHWRRICYFKHVIGMTKWRKWPVGLFFLSTILAAYYWGGCAAILFLLISYTVLAALIARRAYKGIASVDHVRKAVNTALKKKLGKASVKFSDFGGSTGRPYLKIVATNITDGKLQLFSPELTPSVEVADAVAASICLPLIFEPWVVQDKLHFDGGLVSNLPAWPFDEERALDRSSVTITCEVRPSASEQPLPIKAMRRAWLKPTVNTAIFGAGELNIRQSGDSVMFTRSTEINTLDFDLDRSRVKQTIEDAHDAATVKLRWELVDKPDLMKNTSKLVREIVRRFLGGKDSFVATGEAVGRVRVAFAMKEPGNYFSARLRYGAGYEPYDPDVDLRLPLDGSYVGEAFEDGKTIFDVVNWSTFSTGFPGVTPTAVLRQLWLQTWRGMKWLLCVPIVSGSGQDSTVVVLTVDGDNGLIDNRDLVYNRVGLLVSLIQPIATQAIKVFAEKNQWRALNA